MNIIKLKLFAKMISLTLLLFLASCSKNAALKNMPGTILNPGESASSLAKLEWNSTIVNFPNTVVNSSSSVDFILRNNGNAKSDVVNLSWILQVPNFGIVPGTDNCSGKKLDSQEYCSVKIIFKPTTVGAYSNVIKGTDNVRAAQSLMIGTAVNPESQIIVGNTFPQTFPGTFSLNEDSVLNGLLNAVDSSGKALTYEILTQPTKGTISLANSSAGVFSYTPNLNVNGTDSFTFKVTNSDGKVSNISAAIISIVPVNDAPVANNTIVNLDEDTVFHGTLSASDVDSTSLTYTINSVPTKGTLVLNNPLTGAYTYTPNANANGSDSFTFSVSDGALNSNIATVSINVRPINDIPVASNLSFTTLEDTTYTGTFSASDVDGDPLTYGIVTQPSHGTVTVLNATLGLFKYTPALNYNGSDSFSYKANDGTSDSVSKTVSISVTPVNDEPVANNGMATLLEDTVYTGAVSASDVDEDVLNYTVVTQPTKGTIVLNSATGTFTYTPNANENGSDTFTFKANDGTIDSNIATFTLNITPINDAPVASALSFTTLENVAYNGMVHATDVDSPVLHYTVVTQPTKGTITITNSLTGAFTYTPNLNANGSDSFTFKANDGILDSLTKTVSITITPVNQAPIADSATINVNEDTEFTGKLVASDVEGNSLTYTVVAQGNKGTVTIINSATGDFKYTPNLNANGVDSFSFKVNDGLLNSNTATIVVNIVPVNDAPVSNNLSFTTLEDTSYNGTLTASDVDGNTLTYSIVTQGLKGSVTVNSATGAFTYTPNLNANGTDSFTFKTNDGTIDSNTATVSVTITPVNDAPVSNNLNKLTLKNTPVNMIVNSSDVDGDSLTYTVVTQPSNGTLSGTIPNLTYTPNHNYNGSDSFTFKANDGSLDSNIATVNITISNTNTKPTADNLLLTVIEDTPKNSNLIGADPDGDPLTYSVVTQGSKGTITITNTATGAFTYTPNANANGSDSFTFKTNDGALDSVIATVSVTITPVNDAPVSNNSSFTTLEDTAYNGTLTANDVDGDALTYSIVSQGTKGNVSINSTTGAFTYSPNLNANGTDSFTFKTNDGTLNSNTATVSVTITPVNDAPVAFPDSVTTLEDTAKSIVLTGFDQEGSSLTYTIVTNPTKGTLSGTIPNLIYTPNLNANGSDSFTFKVNDGALDSVIATVSITITPVNDAPVSNNSSFTTLEDTAYNGTLTASDVDGNTLTYSVVTQGSKGSVTVNPATGAFTYTPNVNANGSDSFTFKTNDGALDSNTATVSVTITPVNDAPVSNNSSFTTLEDTAYNGTLTASDIDGDSLTYSVASQGSKGIVTITNTATGAFTYTPNANANGTDSFTFKTNDGALNSNTATVSVTITPVNDAPVSNNSLFTTLEDTAYNGTLTANDVDGDSLTYSIVAQGAKGTVVITNAATGTYIYTPFANMTGSDSFTFKTNDGALDSNTATVSVTITPVNDAPISSNSSFTTLEDTAYNGTLTSTDVDGDNLVYSVVTQGSKGIVTITNTATGAFTYTPNLNANGSDSFSFKTNDGTLNSNTATVSVTITPVNDAPVANSQSVSLNEDSSANITLTGTDVEGSALTYTVVTNPTKGTLSGTAPNLTYTPNANYNGADSFTFKVNDGSLNSSTVSVTLNIAPVNDAPVWSSATTINLTTDVNTSVGTTITATDIDSVVSYSVNTCPNGTCTLNSSTGVFSFMPNNGYTGTSIITLRCSDGSLSCSPDTTVNITVVNPNQPPVSVNATYELLVRDTTSNITLSATDPENNALTYSIVSQPSSGTLSGSGPNIVYTPSAWTSCATESGTCSFTGTQMVKYGTATSYIIKVLDGPSVSCSNSVFSDPANGLTKSCWVKPVSDSFTFKANDGQLDSNISTVTLNFTDWYNKSWTNRRKVIFNAPITSSLTNVPVLIRLDSSRVDYSLTQNNGQDIRFVDSNGTLLSHEIETWDESGISLVWVKIPTIGTAETSNKYIWMYYGNPTVADGQNKTDVWSNGYVGVWHFNQTTGSVLDSTSNANNGTVNGSITRSNSSSGVIGNYYKNTATSSCISIPHNTSQLIASEYTIESWLKQSVTSSQKDIMQKNISTGGHIYPSYSLTISSDKVLNSVTDNSLSRSDYTTAAALVSADNEWFNIAVTYKDVANRVSRFKNGVESEIKLDAKEGTYTGTGWSNLNLMGDCINTGFNGSVDEVRLSNSVRTPEWMKVQYLSMTDNLVMYGNEQTFATASNLNSYVLRVSSNLDDGMIVRSNNTLYQSGLNGINWIGETGSMDAWGYFRFVLPVAITSGQTVVNSKIKIPSKTDGTQIWNIASNYLKIGAQKTSNAGQISASNQYPGGAGGVSLTNAVVGWNSTSLNWNFYDVNISPSLNNPINELISTYSGLTVNSGLQFWVNRGANLGCTSDCEVTSADYSLNAASAQLLLEW